MPALKIATPLVTAISTAARTSSRRFYAVLLLAIVAAGPAIAGVHIHSANAAMGVGGTYHAIQPARILDTRDGTGGVPVAPITGGGLLTVQVAGQGGVPAAGVEAAVLNVTVTGTTAAGFLTVFPAGVAMPLASNLNWTPGQTVPNLVEVSLGTGGAVTIYNSAGSTDVIFDVAGYYTTPALSPGPDGMFNPVVPARLLDTRSGNGAAAAQLGSGQSLNLQVAGRGGVPATGVSAVVLNVTVTNPTAAGYVTVWPAGLPRPVASNLNFTAVETVPNRVVVGLGAGGQVSIFNALGATDVIADVNGWFTDRTGAGSGSTFVPTTPARILDSRNGTGGFANPWGPTSGRAITVAGVGGVPAMTDPNPPTAIVANLTVTDTNAPSYLTAWPDAAAQPLASDLNWTRGTVPNLVVVQVGPTGKVDLYNAVGCADVVVDVVGWYTGTVPVTTPGPPPTELPCQAPWLARLNYWRATAGLPPVSENPTWSQGDYLHAIYMVKNNVIQHSETPGTPYYTTAGNLAAQSSNIAVQSSTSVTDTQFVDFWMGAPFHAMGMLDPRLQQSGFGSYREVKSGWEAAAALDVIRGNPFTGGQYPVYWPGNGMTVPLRTYSGGEFPDPLQACPGYSVPTGLPVFVQIGGNVATSVAAGHSFTGNGQPLAHCVIDSTNTALAPYLTDRGGVIVIPRQPLQPGVQYTVTLTVNGKPYTWSFQVS